MVEKKERKSPNRSSIDSITRGSRKPPRQEAMPAIDSGASSTFDRYRPIFTEKKEETAAYSDVIIQKNDASEAKLKECKGKKKKKKNSKALRDFIYYVVMVAAIAGFAVLAFKFG